MKNLFFTALIAIYEAVSAMLEFAPAWTISLINIPDNWYIENEFVFLKVIHINAMVALLLLCILCYMQGLEDGKQNKKA